MMALLTGIAGGGVFAMRGVRRHPQRHERVRLDEVQEDMEDDVDDDMNDDMNAGMNDDMNEDHVDDDVRQVGAARNNGNGNSNEARKQSRRPSRPERGVNAPEPDSSAAAGMSSRVAIYGKLIEKHRPSAELD